MAGRPGKYQPRFTAGQLDLLLQGNTDVDVYSKGAGLMENVRPLPQGGFALFDGTQKIDRVRGLLSPIALTSGPAFPFTATNVGANTVVATFVMPGGAPLSMVDVYNFGGSLPSGPAPTAVEPVPVESPLVAGTISVEYAVGTGWAQLGSALAYTDTLATFRFALPPGQTVTSLQIRIVVNCATSGGTTFYCQQVLAWTETSVISPVRVRPFSYSSAIAYDMVFTAGNIEVYTKGPATRVASIPCPQIGAAQVTTFKFVQELATMLIAHQSFPPTQIVRQGSDEQWNIADAIFTGVPNWDFGDVNYTNFTPAVWQIGFVNFDTQLASSTPPLPPGGCHYTISINGTASYASQQTPGSWGGTAAVIQAMIESIPGVAPGVTVTQVSTASNITIFNITFGGFANEGDGWAVSGVCIDKSDAAITASQLTVGVAGGEPVMSSSRGWPGAIAIYQQRLLLGGFLSLPLGILWSEVGGYYQMNTELTGASAPFIAQLDGQGNETIISMHLGRTLDIFTTRGEYWVNPGTVATTSPPVITYSTNNGIAPTVEPVENEGTTIFCNQNQGALFEYQYAYQFQNYQATNLSVDSSSLIQGIVDNDIRRLFESIDTNELYLVLENGDAVMLALLRSENISAYSQRITDGEFQCVDVNAAYEVNFVVARQVDGQTVQFLEKVIPGLWLDCVEYFDVTPGQTTISGLTDFVGATTVWAIVDGYVQPGPMAVSSSGTIELAFPVINAGQATIGRWTPPNVMTLPQPREIGPKTVLRRPARVHTVRLSIVNSTNVAIGANGEGPWDSPLMRFGGLADTPLSAQPYSGWTFLEGLPGFTDDAIVQITQLRPGALSVTGVTVEVDL